MPKTVDHAERRARITEALVRVAARTGLHTVTLRAVAAEAGVSLRLVQYYFETKANLVHATLRTLERQSRRRWADRLAALPRPVTARAFTEAFCAEALPTDEPSRAFHLIWTSSAVLAMTDPELAARPFVAGPNLLEARLADALAAVRAAGELPPHRRPRRRGRPAAGPQPRPRHQHPGRPAPTRGGAGRAPAPPRGAVLAAGGGGRAQPPDGASRSWTGSGGGP